MPVTPELMAKLRGDDCTHFCSPGANEIWVYLLHKFLEEEEAAIAAAAAATATAKATVAVRAS